MVLDLFIYLFLTLKAYFYADSTASTEVATDAKKYELAH